MVGPCSGGDNENIDTTQMLLYSKNERIYCIVIVSNLKGDLAKSFLSVSYALKLSVYCSDQNLQMNFASPCHLKSSELDRKAINGNSNCIGSAFIWISMWLPINLQP